MKKRIGINFPRLAILVLTILSANFCENIFAQQPPLATEGGILHSPRNALDITIFLNNKVIDSKEGRVVAKVMISNTSDKALPLSKLTYVSFNFSKGTKEIIENARRGDVYSGMISVNEIRMSTPRFKIIPREVQPGQLFDFEVNFSDLIWVDATSNTSGYGQPTGLKSIPAGNYSLFMMVETPGSVSRSGIPLSNIYYSNEVNITLK